MASASRRSAFAWPSLPFGGSRERAAISQAALQTALSPNYTEKTRFVIASSRIVEAGNTLRSIKFITTNDIAGTKFHR